MNNLATHLSAVKTTVSAVKTTEKTEVQSAVVKSFVGGQWIIEDEYGSVHQAMPAVTCLIKPQVGDRVLSAQTSDGATYILSILERTDQTVAHMEFEGDVRMTLPEGRMEIIAKEGIVLGTQKDIELVANKLGLSAEQCEMVLNHLEFVGGHVVTKLGDIKLHADKVQSAIGNAVQIFQKRYVKVEGLDQLHASSIKQVAKDILALRSKFSFMRASKNVKVDGEQILLG